MAHPKRSTFKGRLLGKSPAGPQTPASETLETAADYRQTVKTLFEIWMAAIKTTTILNAGGLALAIGFIGTSWNALPGAATAFEPVIKAFILGVIVAAFASLTMFLYTLLGAVLHRARIFRQKVVPLDRAYLFSLHALTVLSLTMSLGAFVFGCIIAQATFAELTASASDRAGEPVQEVPGF